MSAPGWKGEATVCCIWKCGRLAEFSDDYDFDTRPPVIVYYCAFHAPEDAHQWRTLEDKAASSEPYRPNTNAAHPGYTSGQ